MKTLKELRDEAIAKVESAAIKRALKLTKGNKREAARLLDIDNRTIRTTIKLYID